MLQLTDILKEDNIFTSLKAADKKEVLNILIQSLKLDSREEEAVAAAISERESIISTGVGNGIALPHCKVPGLEENYCAIAILDEPIAFDSIDGVPVNIIFMVVSPKEDNGQHLKLLAHISRILSDKSFRKEIIALRSGEAVLKTFQQEDAKYSIG